MFVLTIIITDMRKYMCKIPRIYPSVNIISDLEVNRYSSMGSNSATFSFDLPSGFFGGGGREG